MPRNVLVDPWERLSLASHGKVHQRWLHRPSGWQLHHCGHPTALWPWQARDPARPDDFVISKMGFPNLAAGASSVELLLEGAAKLGPWLWSPMYRCHVAHIEGVPEALRSTNSAEAWMARHRWLASRKPSPSRQRGLGPC